MQQLRAQFGNWNIASYPPCLMNLVNAHHAQCLRRKEKLKPRKLVLALPWQHVLPQYKQRADAQDIDTYYDHIVYQSDNLLQEILNASTQPFELETYIAKAKIVTVRNAPKGERMCVPNEYNTVCQQSIAMWFSEEEVYWLEMEDDE